MTVLDVSHALATGSNACLLCGSTLVLDTQAQTEVEFAPGYNANGVAGIETRLVTIPVLFCTGCEFAVDVRGL